MPEYEVKVNFPNLPRGEDVYVDNVGMFKNGHSKKVELESEQADALRNSPHYEVKSVAGVKAAATRAEQEGGEK